MQVTSFAPLGLLSAGKRRELQAGIATAEGQKLIGTWCAETGFLVRALVVEGVPTQWWINGPMSREQAREELHGRPNVEALH